MPSDNTRPLSVRTQKEVDKVMDLASQGVDLGSKWPGMTYEEGVYAALFWLTNKGADNPMMEEPSS